MLDKVEEGDKTVGIIGKGCMQDRRQRKNHNVSLSRTEQHYNRDFHRTNCDGEKNNAREKMVDFLSDFYQDSGAQPGIFFIKGRQGKDVPS